MKKCSICKETKPYTEFYKSNYKSRGYQTACKPCAYSLKKDWLKRNNNRYLDTQLRFGFNITVQQYDEMLKEQDGKCKICKQTTDKRLSVDHCHKTGKIRGLLCFRCNSGLGMFKDNLDFLANAIEYLKG